MYHLDAISIDELPEDHIVINVDRIYNSTIRSAYEALKLMGFFKCKKIPIFNRNDVGIPVYYYSRGTLLTNNKYNIILISGSIIIHKKHIYDFHLEYKKLVCKYRNTKIPEKIQAVSLIDQLVSYINNEQLINKETVDNVIEQLRPYIATYHERREFDINMNLSLIFCGKPGDGKSYFAFGVARYISCLLSLPYTEETGITFEKAIYVKQDFVSVLDDMILAHFQRHSSTICQKILTETDKNNCNRLFFMTTNEQITRSTIDHAFFRPGRVQDIIEFTDPDNDVKQKWLDKLLYKLKINKKSIDSNTIAGIQMAVFDRELTLANLMRYRNLLFTDIILYGKVKNPLDYVKDSLAVQPVDDLPVNSYA